MSSRRRIVAAIVTAGAIMSFSAPATSAAHTPSAPSFATTKLTTPAGKTARTAVVDGITFGKLPTGLGVASTFDSTTDDETTVTNQVWESEDDEGWTVDLSIGVYRSSGLTSATAFRDWLVTWQERPAGEAQYRRTQVQGTTVWIGHDQAFWLVAPGIGASVRLDTSRWSHGALQTIVRSSVRR